MFQINSHKRFPCCISLGSFLMTNSMLLMFLMHGRSDIAKRCITLLLNTVQGIFMAPFLHVEPPHNSSCPHKGRQWPFRRSVRLTSLHINLVLAIFFFFLNGYISAVTQVHNSRQLSVKQVRVEADHDDFLNCRCFSSTQHFIHQDKNSLQFRIYEKEAGMSWRRELTQLTKSSWPWTGECPVIE